MNIPKDLFSGDSLSWDDVASVDNLGNDVSSTLWTLKYDFRQAGVANLSVTATAQGSGWRTTLTAAQSALWAAGPLYWQAYATKSSERVTLGSGSVVIKKNIVATPNSAEFRTQSEQDLAACDAAIRAMLTGGAVQEYTIGGRSLRKIPVENLITLRDKLNARVIQEKKAERLKNGESNKSNILVRFNK